MFRRKKACKMADKNQDNAIMKKITSPSLALFREKLARFSLERFRRFYNTRDDTKPEQCHGDVWQIGKKQVVDIIIHNCYDLQFKQAFSSPNVTGSSS